MVSTKVRNVLHILGVFSFSLNSLAVPSSFKDYRVKAITISWIPFRMPQKLLQTQGLFEVLSHLHATCAMEKKKNPYPVAAVIKCRLEQIPSVCVPAKAVKWVRTQSLGNVSFPTRQVEGEFRRTVASMKVAIASCPSAVC